MADTLMRGPDAGMWPGQGGLFDPPLKPARPPSHRDEFEAFHEAHPEVFSEFERFALEAADAGARRIGARLVWERVRWERNVISREAGEPWALNNNLVPFYARHFLKLHPEHRELRDAQGKRTRQGLFELRRCEGADE